MTSLVDRISALAARIADEFNAVRGEIGAGGGGSGSVDWGDIGGTLADQTDLQAELDGKAPMGWTQIGSTLSLTGTAVSFTSIPGTYQDLMILIDGATPNVGTTIRLEISSNNGSNYSAAPNITANSTAPKTGHIFLYGYRSGLISIRNVTIASVGAAPSNAAATTDTALVGKLSGPLNALRLSPAGSNSFTAGTAALFGR